MFCRLHFVFSFQLFFSSTDTFRLQRWSPRGHILKSIRFNCIITRDFITKIFVNMLIAVFIFSFFTQTLLLNAFFTTTLVILYHSNAQEFDNKSFGFNPSPAKPKLIRRNAYPSISRRLREISHMSSSLHFHKT